MNATDFSPHPIRAMVSDWTVGTDEPVRLQERCTRRVCYAQKTAIGGEKTSGHFSMEANLLADAVWRQISQPDAGKPHPSDLALYRWLADCDRHDDQVTTLPAEWCGLEAVIEQLFTEGCARVFCTSCNRNFQRREVRLERSSLLMGTAPNRYFCPEGHLLFVTAVSRRFAVAERRAA